MSEHMRKPPIKPLTINIVISDQYHYSIPLQRMKDLVSLLESIKYVKKMDPKDKPNEWLTTEECFTEEIVKYTSPGVSLQGARHKEGLTQGELAKLLGVRQENLSKMENGKRPISLAMAKRLAKVLNIDYRVFL
jgi:DNA-binding XRE family transcriptional regulator